MLPGYMIYVAGLRAGLLYLFPMLCCGLLRAFFACAFDVRGVAPREAIVDAIIGRDTLLGLKPAPDMVLRALELFSAEPSTAAFVGDSEADLAAARSAGIRFFGVASTEPARDRLLAAGAENIFSSPAALAIHLNLFRVSS